VQIGKTKLVSEIKGIFQKILAILALEIIRRVQVKRNYYIPLFYWNILF